MLLDPLRNEEDVKEYVDLRLGPMGEIGDCVANLDGETIGVFGGIPCLLYTSPSPRDS